GSTQPRPSRDMPFVVLWSDIAQGSCCREERPCGIFDAIFVPATKGPALTQVYPISPGRRLFPGRRLSPRCIPSRPALSFQPALAPHRNQARNLFRRTSRWLLLEEPYTL